MTFSSLILTLIILTPLLGALALFFVDSLSFRKNRNIAQKIGRASCRERV